MRRYVIDCSSFREIALGQEWNWNYMHYEIVIGGIIIVYVYCYQSPSEAG